jgi:hypothetical protein
MRHHDTVALAHQLSADHCVLRDQTDRCRPPREPECLVPDHVDLRTVGGVLNVQGVNQVAAAEGGFRLLTVRGKESRVVEQVSEHPEGGLSGVGVDAVLVSASLPVHC